MIDFSSIHALRVTQIKRSRRHAIAIGLMSMIIVSFWPIDGGTAFAAGHGDPEPAKPAEVKPAPVPLPPRPTEYPRGLNQKPRPGEAAKPAPAGAEHVVSPVGHGHETTAPTGHDAPPAEAKVQAMPAPAKGEDPEGVAKPNESMIPKPADMAAKVAHWTPPKRYHFVMDAYTGLAIGGNDPVSFFVDGEQREGSSDFELDWGGTTWHFTSEGNMLAFKQNPEVYAPRFGGRCAFALSQGLLVEGHPQFFVIHRDRLYIFTNAGNRAAFLTNPDALAREAERMWPQLTRGEP